MATLKRTSILLVFAFLAHASLLQAQWIQNVIAPNKVTCIRWLQDEGFRKYGIKNLHHGLLGGGQSGVSNTQFISYCPSGPSSVWTAATISPSNTWTDGWISDFAFEDSLVGYASVYGASASFYNSPSVSGMMKTTDGGASWTFLSGAPPEIRGMFYDWTNNRLYCSSGDVDDIGGNGAFSGAWVSRDHGASWSRITVTSPTPPACPTPFNQRCYYSGFASWDGIHIVLATEGSPNPCGQLDPPCSPFWLYSEDGGLTWKTSAMSPRSWQPVAIKNTQTFYASSNSVPPNGTSVIYVSSDGGKHWLQDQQFTGTSSNVTEVMGGDPCIILAPDSTGSANFYSSDDGQSWSGLSGLQPAPPIDYRSYIGGDSIWLFQNRTLKSTARPQSNPLHLSPTGFFFGGSGCGMSDTVINIYGCNCNNVVITGSSVQQIYGTGQFIVTGLTTPQNVCGPSQFKIQYLPASTNQDSAEVTINYTNSGSPQTLIIGAKGNGAPTDFQTSWGSKPPPSQNPITLFAAPCQRLDTGFWIYNPTCADIQIVQLDATGDTQEINFGSGVSLPFTIPQKGGMVFFPISAIASSPNPAPGYHLTITIRTQSGGIFVTKTFYITLFVQGSPVKPFVRPVNIKVPFACGPIDTAIYYFDTTCLPAIISNVHLSKATNFELDLSKVRLPDTLQSINSGTGVYSLRIPVRLTSTRPGAYSDTIIFDDQISDGTILRTTGLIRVVIDGTINLAPTALTPLMLSFDSVRDCDSAYVTFKDSITNTCNLPVVVSNIQTMLWAGQNKNQYRIVEGPSVGDTLKVGSVMTLKIAWPFGAQNTPPQGWVKITYRHDQDSATLQHTFSGLAVPCIAADVGSPIPAGFSIRSDGNQLLISTGESSSARFELQNLLGATILSSTFSGSTSIDDRSLAAGVYVYRVTIGDRVMTGKITLP